MEGKRAEVLNQVVIHIILIAILFGLLFMATAGRASSREVKQQVLEKQMALLIDSAVPGMSFEISKANLNGIVGDVRIEGNNIFIDVEGFPSLEGYPFLSPYSVEVMNLEDYFRVVIK